MSLSGPSPLGTLMVQRVEAALGVTGAQQANVATGARPDAVSQPGRPENLDPAKNPPPKEHDGSRQAKDPANRQVNLAALARTDPEIAKLLAARNAPMTSYTASAPTTLGQAAKLILSLFQELPEARPSVPGRAPLLSTSPGAPPSGTTPTTSPGTPTAGSGQATTHSSTHTSGPAPGAGNPSATPGQGTANAPMGSGPSLAASTGQNAAAASQEAGRGAAPLNRESSASPSGQSAPAVSSRVVMSPALPSGGPVVFSANSGSPHGSMIAQLAQSLSNALQGSGLFYESHLRDFTLGQRTLNQLRSEPQAHAGAPQRASSGANPSAGSDSLARTTGNEGNAHSTTQGSQSSQASAQGSSAATASSSLSGSLLGLDPSTHVLVRQQLETLANQSFSWHGEAWPGAELDWEVRRQTQGGGTAEEPDHWATRLKVNLPGLGEVQARLSLSGSQLVLHLAAPESAEIMAEHTSLLRQRLGEQGLKLSQLSISHDTDELPGGTT